MSVRGFNKVLRNLAKKQKEIKGALAAAIYQKGLAIMRDSKRRTPVDSGRLRATGYVAPPTTIERPETEVGFGTDYALAVHERVEVFHKVGGPLFLKSVVDEHQSGYSKWIADRARRNLKSGIVLNRVPRTEPKRPKE